MPITNIERSPRSDRHKQVGIILNRCRTPNHATRTHPEKQRGQAYIFIVLGLTVLCGMLALAVDVGVTSAHDQSLRHDANSAAYAGAYALYGYHLGANPGLTDADVWNALVSKLSAVGLTVHNAAGSTPPSDPCATGYPSNQAAMKAVYLGPNDAVLTTLDGNPWLVGSGTIPAIAYGVKVSLGNCQPAGFGAVVGHSMYTIWVDGSAGLPLPGPVYTPTPLASSTSASVADAPFSITGAPNGDCGGNPSNDKFPAGARGDPEQFYCPGSYNIGSSVTFYANGRGLGNNYGHDSNFKGYTGGSYNFGEQHWSTGGGNNAPRSCPSQWRIPIISGVHHSGDTDYFVVLEYVIINVTACGDPSTGTIASVYDPFGYGVVSAPATPTPTNTPTNTATPVPTATPIPILLRAAASTGSSGHVNGLTISTPAGTQSGDVLVAQLALNSGPFAITAPAGWTQIRQDNYSGVALSQVLYYHVAGSAEPSSYTWSWSPGVNAAGAIGAYSGVNSTTPIMASSGDASQFATSSETAPSLTTTANSADVLGLFSILNTSTIGLPSGEIQQWTVQAANLGLSGGSQIQSVAGPTGPQTATGAAPDNMIGQLVALNPLPPPATPTPSATPLPTATPTLTATASPSPPPTATTAPPIVHHP